MKQIRHKKYGVMLLRDCALGEPGCLISQHSSLTRAEKCLRSWARGGWDGFMHVAEVIPEEPIQPIKED